MNVHADCEIVKMYFYHTFFLTDEQRVSGDFIVDLDMRMFLFAVKMSAIIIITILFMMFLTL